MTAATQSRNCRIARALLLSTIPVSIGCPPVCEGAGCETTFDAAMVTIQRGADQAASDGETVVADPTAAALDYFGESGLGPEWSLAFAGNQLAIGMGDTSSVRTFDLPVVSDPTRLADQGNKLLGETPGDSFGSAVAVVPDMDGDGVAELIVGAPLRDGSSTSLRDGAVYLLSGLGDGFTDWQTDPQRLLRVVGDQSGALLGQVVAGCADMDGDGGGDIAFSAPRYGLQDSGGPALVGRVWLVGSASIQSGADIGAGALSTSFSGGNLGAAAGNALDCKSDLSGDGLADLVVGAPFADFASTTSGGSDSGVLDAAGRVYVIESGSEHAHEQLEDVADVARTGDVADAWLGWSVATGDVDGDGHTDLAAGEPGTQAQTGRVLIWLGPDFGSDGSNDADYRVLGAEPGDGFGRTVSLADLDSDGVGDLLVGAPKHNPGPSDPPSTFDSGALYRLDGPPDTWAVALEADRMILADSVADITWFLGQQYLRTGQAFALGDYDEDGLVDIALLHRHD